MAVPWGEVFDVLIGLLLFCFILSTTVTPVIALLLRLFKKARFLKTWVISSAIVSAIFLFISVIPITAVVFENAINVKRVDKQFEETETEDVAKVRSTDHVLAEIFKTGGYGRSGRHASGSPSVNVITKNYNADDFSGTLVIYAMYDGEKIGEQEFEMDVPSEEWVRKSMEPSELNIDRAVWDNVEIDYQVEGEFN